MCAATLVVGCSVAPHSKHLSAYVCFLRAVASFPVVFGVWLYRIHGTRITSFFFLIQNIFEDDERYETHGKRQESAENTGRKTYDERVLVPAAHLFYFFGFVPFSEVLQEARHGSVRLGRVKQARESWLQKLVTLLVGHGPESWLHLVGCVPRRLGNDADVTSPRHPAL